MTKISRQFEEPSSERLLPVSNGKFAMWLFLSTEIMFFAGLFASFIVLRSAAPDGIWPKHEWVHVHFSLGLINTIILTLSSVSAWMALKACGNSSSGRVRLLLGITILLGIAFLSVKAFEYKSKIDLGIRPVPQSRQVYDQPDIYYLAAVRKGLTGRLVALQRRKSNLREDQNEASEQMQSQIDRLGSIRNGLVLWTEQQIAGSNDLAEQRRMLERFASDIYSYEKEQGPHGKSAMESELDELSSGMAEVSREYVAANSEIETLNKQISKHVNQRLQLEQSKEPEGDETENAESQRQIAELNVKISQLEKDKPPMLLKAAALRQNIVPLEDRIEYLRQSKGEPGINYWERPIGLPLVIPSGGTWMNLYYLLTGMHAIHVLIGLLFFAGLLLTGLRKKTTALHNCVLYWHFVDVVWLVMFAVIYF